MSAPPTQTLYGLQYLRFIAATMVILVHAAEQISRFGHHDITAQMSVGSSGVDIFFVISGFLMCLITFGKNVGTREFLVHRFTAGRGAILVRDPVYGGAHYRCAIRLSSCYV